MRLHALDVMLRGHLPLLEAVFVSGVGCNSLSHSQTCRCLHYCSCFVLTDTCQVHGQGCQGSMTALSIQVVL